MAFQDHLLERIQNLPRLTPGEARIADYFQRKRSSLAFETATSISRRTGLSKATVVRFISRLGYDGFADFQERLKNEFMDLLESPIKRFTDKKDRAEGNEKDYLGSMIASTMGNLNKIQDRNDSEKIMSVARLLASSRGNLYVMGMLTSFGLAQIFWSMANYLRRGVILIDNRFSSLPNQMVNITPEDVLLAVTHRRYSRATDLTINHFVGLGGKVVLLTDSILNPISTLAEHVLVAPSEGPHLFDTHCSALILMESLVAAMADLLADNLHHRFQLMDDLFKHYGAFSPGLDYNLEERVKQQREDRLKKSSRAGEDRD